MVGLDQVHGLAGWKWLFLIEAIPAVALGVLAYFYLDDKPENAKWLRPEEKVALQSALAADVTNKSSHASTTVVAMLKNPFTAVLIVWVFAQATAQYALSFCDWWAGRFCCPVLHGVRQPKHGKHRCGRVRDCRLPGNCRPPDIYIA